MARKLITPPSLLTGRGTLSDVSGAALSGLEPGTWLVRDDARGLPAGTAGCWRLALVMREHVGLEWAVMLPLPATGVTDAALVVRASSGGDAFWGRLDVAGLPS